LQFSNRIPPNSCNIPTEITGAQNFNFAAKFPKNGKEVSGTDSAFFGQKVSDKKKFLRIFLQPKI